MFCMKLSKHKVKNGFAVLFLFAPLLFPTGLQYSSAWNWLYYGLLYDWRILSCGICAVLYAVRALKGRLSVKSLLFFLCVLTLGLSTVFRGGSLNTYLSTWGGYFCFYIGAEYFLKKDAVLFCRVLKKWLGVIAVINLISILAHPFGMPLDRISYQSSDSYLMWFWGFKNSICNLIIPYFAVAIALEYLQPEKKKRALWFPIAISLLTAALARSTTLILGVVVLTVLLCFKEVKVLRKIVNPKTMAIAGIAISVFVVFFRFQNVFAWLIEGILQKDLSLSTRTILWRYALRDIAKKPFFGYGVQTAAEFGLTRYAASFNHCHNAILMILYQGGLSALLTYGAFFLYSVFGKRTDVRQALAYEYGAVLFFQLICHVSGSVSGVGLFLVLLLVDNIRVTKPPMPERKQPADSKPVNEP